ncbi:MAG: hypothetical protein ACREJV_03995, partial [Candidatus Rokuibacteriota bacterium]
EEIAEAVRRFEAVGPSDPLRMFDHVYAELPPHLTAQREELAARLRQSQEPDQEPESPSPPMRGQRRTTRWQS